MFRSEYGDKFHKKPFVEATPQFLWYVWRHQFFAELTGQGTSANL